MSRNKHKNREKNRIRHNKEEAKKINLAAGKKEENNNAQSSSSQVSEKLLGKKRNDENSNKDTKKIEPTANETSTKEHKKNDIMEVDVTSPRKKKRKSKHKSDQDAPHELKRQENKPSDEPTQSSSEPNENETSEGWNEYQSKRSKNKSKSMNSCKNLDHEMEWQNVSNTQSNDENRSSKNNRDEHHSKKNRDNSSHQRRDSQNLDRDLFHQKGNSQDRGRNFSPHRGYDSRKHDRADVSHHKDNRRKSNQYYNNDRKNDYRNQNRNSSPHQRQNDHFEEGNMSYRYFEKGDTKNTHRFRQGTSEDLSDNQGNSRYCYGKGGKFESKNNFQKNKPRAKKKNKQPLFVPNAEHYEPTIREVQGDLFECSDEYSLAHCVAEDFSMGAGIAIEFKQRFKGVNKLLAQDKRTGEVAILQNNQRFIFYLVTKTRSIGKPTIGSFTQSIKSLKQICRELNVKKLAIPRIGCGLDGLDWNEVKDILFDEFSSTGIEIVVYVL